MRVLAIIPARGGSKGIPRKNIIPLCGKHLIQYTVEAVQKCTLIDRCLLSTDDQETIDIVKKIGIYSKYVRPDYLSGDTASMADTVLDAIYWLEEHDGYYCDAVMVLQPTSPLRSSMDIELAIRQFEKSAKSCLVSVHPMIEHPYECVYNIEENKNWHFLAKPEITATRRQDYKNSFYYINGAIYLVDVNFFKAKKLFMEQNSTSFYIMPSERGIDIDERIDLELAEFYLEHNCGLAL